MNILVKKIWKLQATTLIKLGTMKIHDKVMETKSVDYQSNGL